MLYEISTFFQDLTSSSPMMAEAIAAEGGFMEGLDQIDGFPLRIVDYEDDQPSSETMVKSVKEETLAAEVFRVPAGYTEKSLDDE